MATENVYTEKGAISYGTTRDARIDLFFQALRRPSLLPMEDYIKNMQDLIVKSWEVDQLDTLKIMFYTRDCRGGRGERDPFVVFYKWLIQNHIDVAEVNMDQIHQFGYFKDYLSIFSSTPLQSQMVQLFTNQLRADLRMLESDPQANISLAGKYAPSEGKVFDKKTNVLTELRQRLGVSRTEYRKNILTPLRNRLQLVEQKMSSKQFDQIDYSHVPSRAGVMYRKAFSKRDKERYGAYLTRVSEGKEKINTTHVLPGDLTKDYISGHWKLAEPVQANEVMWADMKKTFLELRVGGNNFLPILDVSGSMFAGEIINHCIGLGCMLASTNPSEKLRDKFIVFSTQSSMYELTGNTLFENIKGISKLPVGYSTVFQSAFDRVLELEDIPQYLIVFSDMQFDIAEQGNTQTNFEVIRERFRFAEKPMPKLIFWNLSGSVHFPATKDDDVILLSGFSTDAAKLILQGELPSPYGIVRKAIDNERYMSIKLPIPKPECVIEWL